MSAPHADRDHSEQPPSTTTTGSDPTQPGTSRAEAAREVRASEAQVEAAMRAMDCKRVLEFGGYPYCDLHEFGWLSDVNACPRAEAVADAVVAAGVDADEVTRLRGELKRLGREVAKVARERSAAEAERDEVAGRLSALLCELTGGRLSKTTYDVPTMVAEIDSAYDDAHQEDWDELERLAEVVARVEALADEWEKYGPGSAIENVMGQQSLTVKTAITSLRAALSGPTPAQPPQSGPEPALSREQGTSGQSGEGEALRGAEKGEVPDLLTALARSIRETARTRLVTDWREVEP